MSYLKTADIFLNTSLYEGYGLSIVEAAAAGLAIVTSNVGITPEIIENGISGFLCAPDDLDCFSKSLMELSKDGDLRKQFGQKAKAAGLKFAGGSKEDYLVKMKNDLLRCLPKT